MAGARHLRPRRLTTRDPLGDRQVRHRHGRRRLSVLPCCGSRRDHHSSPPGGYRTIDAVTLNPTRRWYRHDNRASFTAVDHGSLPGHHRDRLAFEVDVRFAADVDRDAVDRPAGELVWMWAGVVAGDRFACVAADAQPFAAD